MKRAKIIAKLQVELEEADIRFLSAPYDSKSEYYQQGKADGFYEALRLLTKGQNLDVSL